MLISRLAVYTIIAIGLTGCAGMTAVRKSDDSENNPMVKAESEKLWQENKGWLLSKLPKTYSFADNLRWRGCNDDFRIVWR